MIFEICDQKSRRGFFFFLSRKSLEIFVLLTTDNKKSLSYDFLLSIQQKKIVTLLLVVGMLDSCKGIFILSSFLFDFF